MGWTGWVGWEGKGVVVVGGVIDVYCLSCARGCLAGMGGDAAYLETGEGAGGGPWVYCNEGPELMVGAVKVSAGFTNCRGGGCWTGCDC